MITVLILGIVDMDTLNSVVVKTETPQNQEFWSCQDRDSLRPEILEFSRPRLLETGNFGVVETGTGQDWAKVVETETFSRVSLYSTWTTQSG